MEPKVAVIGTTFIDSKGFAKQEYNPYGRNLGDIQFVHGGVGRNVAENLANLNLYTFFVSVVDNSALGHEVGNRLRKSNVFLDFLGYADNKGMGMWLAILDQNGDLAGSISQMPDLSNLEKLMAEKGQQVIESSSHIVLELDLNSAISRQVIELAQKYGKRVYGIPGNLEVILNNRDILSCLECFICNDIEAGRLFNIDLTRMGIRELETELFRIASEAKIPSMVITLGARGAVYYDARIQETGYQPAFPTQLVDSSGAGDAFFSGTVMGLIRNRPLSEAVAYGAKVASWTIQVEENTCPDLSEKLWEEEMFRKVMAVKKTNLRRQSFNQVDSLRLTT